MADGDEHAPILPIYEEGPPSVGSPVASGSADARDSLIDGFQVSDFDYDLLAGPSERTNGGPIYPNRSRSPRRRRPAVASRAGLTAQLPAVATVAPTSAHGVTYLPAAGEGTRRMAALDRDPLRRQVAQMFPLAALMRVGVAPLASPTEDLLDLSDAPGDGFRRVDQRIEALTRGGRQFYVGITENPSRRWSEHDTGMMWERMEIMLRAGDSEVTGGLERRVLQKWLSHPLCRNVAPGGERSSEGSPHHLYILIGQSHGLIRRRPGG